MIHWFESSRKISRHAKGFLLYNRIQEFLSELERSRICCKCCNCAVDGTWVLPLLREFKCCGKVCRRRHCNARLKSYFNLAWMRSSLNTCEMFKFSFADTSTKPFSHFIVTSSLVLSVSTYNRFFAIIYWM